MDFTFNADQDELRRTVRSFMERQSPSSYVRSMIDDDRGFTDDVGIGIREELLDLSATEPAEGEDHSEAHGG